MTEKTIDLLLVVPSLLVVVLLSGAAAVGTSEKTRQARRARQLSELRGRIAKAPRSRLDVDWMLCNEVPKAEVIEVANRDGWVFESQHVSGKTWTLRFSRQTTEFRHADDSQVNYDGDTPA